MKTPKMAIKIVACLMLILLGATFGCVELGTVGNKTICYLNTLGNNNWHEAKEMCEVYYRVVIMSIESKEEMDFLQLHLPPLSPDVEGYFVGGQDIGGTQQYRWETANETRELSPGSFGSLQRLSGNSKLMLIRNEEGVLEYHIRRIYDYGAGLCQTPPM